MVYFLYYRRRSEWCVFECACGCEVIKRNIPNTKIIFDVGEFKLFYKCKMWQNVANRLTIFLGKGMTEGGIFNNIKDSEVSPGGLHHKKDVFTGYSLIDATVDIE